MNNNITPYMNMQIESIINSKRKDPKLQSMFPNPLLREDVLDLLDLYCTVVYYPLEKENNHGFHITDIHDKNGKKNTFVYINTAQSLEKQIFTAAHELGHIWDVDSIVLSKVDAEASEEGINEDIINRFAAILLMPKEQFISAFYSELNEQLSDGEKTTLVDMIIVIVKLMNLFFVPFMSVVLRMRELGLIPEKIESVLLGQDEIPGSIILSCTEIVIKQCGFIKLNKPTNKKWIDNLPEMLDEAEKKNTVTKEKIQSMRDTFNLTSAEKPDDTLEKELDIFPQE